MPKIVDHDAMRSDLVTRSAALFGAHGFRRLTMRAIAKELGVSTGTLYHYYPGKDALFQAVFESVLKLDLAAAADALSGAQDDAQGRVNRLFAFAASRQEAMELYALITIDYLRSLGDEKERLFQLTLATRQRYIAGVTAYLQLHDPAYADLVILAINGAIHRRLIGGIAMEANPGLELLGGLIVDAIDSRAD